MHWENVTSCQTLKINIKANHCIVMDYDNCLEIKARMNTYVEKNQLQFIVPICLLFRHNSVNKHFT